MNLPAYTEALNPSQREAVLHTEGPLLVFAGAGSGKTRVLTYRILHLIRSGAALPHEILAVTFTNKAAKEMKQRVNQLVGDENCSVWVSTFHSTCVRILRAHAETLGFNSQFAIYDRSDSTAALKRVMKRQEIDPRQLSPKSVLQEIDRAKNKYIDPEAYRSMQSMQYDVDDRVYELYLGYQEELQRSNAMDFGDLLCNTVSLFKLDQKLLAKYQKQFRYILVDEYQDTNPVQYILLQQLAEVSNNLCVVGDDDQSIYAFRGASIDNILSFQNDFSGGLSVTLDQNYRSTKTILSAANAVIEKNKKRQKKTLFTDNALGEPITCYCADDERDEARYVAEQIQLAAANGVRYSDMAIFYRTNAQSRALEEALTDSAVPFVLYGGLRFYQRKEIRDLLCYLKLIANPSDSESFLRVVNTPARGIGASSIKKIQELSISSGTSLFEALNLAIKQETLSKAAIKKCSIFTSLIEGLRENNNYSNDFLARLLHSIAESSGYLATLKEENTEESLSRIENLQELFAVAQEFVIADFLDRTSLISDLDSENTVEGMEKASSGSVSMMTLHLAKGLEFSYAFLVGLEDGLLPHIRSLDS
ncbi:UNVERIFIED_CONTAM: hypothetical protein GTU68_019100, partial [Idotea baltica]|nr:hypothetical protein [Idotea baltica]